MSENLESGAEVAMSSAIERRKQDVLTGSARLIRRATEVEDRVSHMIRNIRQNKAYQYALARETERTPDELAAEVMPCQRPRRGRIVRTWPCSSMH
jgi:hypothetical protein